jgi:hypothetical protein
MVQNNKDLLHTRRVYRLSKSLSLHLLQSLSQMALARTRVLRVMARALVTVRVLQVMARIRVLQVMAGVRVLRVMAGAWVEAWVEAWVWV